MSLLVVYNPVCGDSTAEQFFNAHVIPRLRSANQIPVQIIRTRAPGDAGVNVLDFLKKRKTDDVTVVLGSGDGTLHEILNHLVPVADLSSSVRFVLVPCGTANALYASLFGPIPQLDTITYKLRSLEAFLQPSSLKPLSLSFTSLLGPSGGDHGYGGTPIASVVVTSTALHAAILNDSERLRKQIPGVERFKVAAQQNVLKWCASRVRLLPVPSSGVACIYDPRKGDFVPIRGASQSDSALDFHGPFAYFLSTTNVDRLESMFRINPTISMNPATDTSMDVIMVRPKRNPAFTLDTPQARETFAEKTFAVFDAAYQDGNHIYLRYSEDGHITESGNGDLVVECFRCGGWEWIPDEADEDAHLLCVDGAIFQIEKGGRAICSRALQLADTTSTNFYAYI